MENKKVVFDTREGKMAAARARRFHNHLANYMPGYSKRGAEATKAMNNFMGFDSSSMIGKNGITFNGGSLDTYKGDHNQKKRAPKNGKQKEVKGNGEK